MITLRALAANLPRFYLPALVFVLSSAVAMLYIDNRAGQVRRQEAEAVNQALELGRSGFLKNLNSVMYLTTGVVAYIQSTDGFIPANQAISWLRSLHDYNPYIRNIGLAPGNRIRFLYPIEGNEKALGVYYPDLADQWPRVRQAMETRRAVIDGPVQLVQGGVGLIHRAPVYLEDGRYWGMISTVMRFDSITSDVQALAARQGVELRFLTRPDQSVAVDAGWQVVDLQVDDMRWRLAGRRFDHGQGGTDYAVILAWLLVLLATLTTWRLGTAAWHQRMLQDSLSESLTLFRVAFERVPHGLIILDKARCIVEANPVMQHLLGWSEVMRGLKFEKVIAKNHRQDLGELFTAQGADESATCESELLSLAQDKVIPVEISVVGLQHGQLGSLVFVRDIRDSRRLQQAQNEFISTASHELRTPLTSIIGALELVKSGTLGEMPREAGFVLDMAAANSDRLQKLINDLLDSNRLILGRMQLSLVPVYAEDVARGVAMSLQPIATQSRVTLRLEADGEPRVMADKDKLAQVLVNLLANAIRFSHEGGEVIVRIAPEDDLVRFSVQDFGRGIDPSFAAKAFTRFGQADSSDSRELGGTGLGLFICKGLVESMHGQIGYESQPGQGATFWFELPRVLEQVEPAA